jgi:uncharacterized protein (UPF0332 family)
LDNTTEKLIKGFIEKSGQKLNASRALYREGFFEDAVSRAYYAVFHGAQALLFSEGEKATTHKGVVTLFGLLFIKTGKFDKKFGKILVNLKDDRETGDYEIFSWMDEESAGNAVREAEEFLEETQKYFAGIGIIL